MPILQNILNMFSATLALWMLCPLNTSGEKNYVQLSRVVRNSLTQKAKSESLFIFPACTYVLTEGNMFHPFLLTIILVLIFFSIHLFFKGGWSQVLLCLFLHQLHRFDQKRLSREESSEQHTSSLTHSLKSPQLSHIRISFTVSIMSLAFKTGFS